MRRYRSYKRVERKPEQRIEFPARGSTYCRQEYGVYEYSTYERSSVLAGQQRRVFLDSFKTLEEAKAKYPGARADAGCGYQAPYLNHLPDADGPDPLGDNQDACNEGLQEGR